jgi:hypothetical protein
MSKNSLKITKVKKIVNRSRKVLVKDIINNLESLSDDDITKIHNIALCKDIDNKKTVKVSKAKKVTKTAKITKNNKKDVSDNEENSEDKQKVEIIIKVLNNMLRAVELDEIDDLIDFKIRRDNLIDDKAVLSVESDYDSTFKSKLFKRKDCGWYRHKYILHYNISFLKGIVNSTNDYEFISRGCRLKNDKHTDYLIIKK